MKASSYDATSFASLCTAAEAALQPKVVSHSYLAFVGQPITRRSFERIESASGQLNFNDKWLQYVEAKLHGRQD